MTNINCSVSNCSHNSSNVCYANRVDIGGGESSKYCSTCCGSFLNRDVYGTLTNNSNDSGACSCLVCNVPGCAHYSNHVCQLSSISVNGKNPTVYSETNCSSYKKR
ncbi:MAG: DUF1540 domain-containing protein [Clostridium sp.]